ncbi:hypothetical protein IFM89_035559 [Coptis chinensis]|uniref:Nuclear pore localisation protein NPL4 C-terminal domain-containing protein n=1 Tax=Coptis chinensis TaxID=261450 RepID=A0A835M1M3_9MAGN|nr:hypothetical protein IFM89_035559 [Coptis chinensis]
MTMDDLIAKQMRVTRQETAHCESVSFDRDTANVFQGYVNENLAFAAKRGGFMYGTVGEDGRVEVDFIYEMPQQGSEEGLLLFRDENEDKCVEAIAGSLGMRKVGFIFTQTIGQGNKDYTLSNAEVLQAAELHGESGLKEWVTAIVKMEVNEDGGNDVHFEAFQLSDMCVRLFKDGWFETDVGEGFDPKLSRMKKEVVIGSKDVKEVDNDFFLVVVKILDHQVRYYSMGHFQQNFLSRTGLVENRIVPVTMRALKTHLDKSKNLPFVKKISDYHLLLLLSRFLDPNADIPALAECVQTGTSVPEGYQLLIDSMANAS